jgi:hypothetical protein
MLMSTQRIASQPKVKALKKLRISVMAVSKTPQMMLVVSKMRRQDGVGFCLRAVWAQASPRQQKQMRGSTPGMAPFPFFPLFPLDVSAWRYCGFAI